MKIAIIDDQSKDSTEISKLISQYSQQQCISTEVLTYQHGADFLDDLQNHVFDLIILDIYMGDMDGIEVARRLRQQNFTGLIVFSTVSTDHAVTGYSVQAFDYLVKPYDYSRFKVTMDRCMKELSHKDLYIVVKESRTHVKIRLADIVFTDYHNHYIQIHTSLRVIKSYMQFQDFLELLKPYPQFLNCYRNCVVNMDHVTCLKGYEFLLSTGDIMPITRNRKNDIKQKYADYEFYRLKRGDF